MSPRRYAAALLATLTFLAGSSQIAGILPARWLAVLVMLVAGGHAFLSALGSGDATPAPTSEPGPITPWAGPIDPAYVAKLKAALSAQAARGVPVLSEVGAGMFGWIDSRGRFTPDPTIGDGAASAGDADATQPAQPERSTDSPG